MVAMIAAGTPHMQLQGPPPADHSAGVSSRAIAKR